MEVEAWVCAGNAGTQLMGARRGGNPAPFHSLHGFWQTLLY